MTTFMARVWDRCDSSTRSWLVLAVAMVAGAQLQGQIYVSEYYDANHAFVRQYTSSGTLVNPTLISDLHHPNFMALDGAGQLYVSDEAAINVGKYTASGTPINPSLISGLYYEPEGIAISGNNLFVARFAADQSNLSSIGLYTTSGATVNASLITGPVGFTGIALDGEGHIFVANDLTGTIGEYTTSGATVNASLISGLNGPWGLACDGNGHLFVSDNWGGDIREYSTSGQVINASLVTGLNRPDGIALDGNGHLFVCIDAEARVAEYTTSGDLVNPQFISGFRAVGIVIAPEPSSAMLFAIGSAFL